VAFNDSSHDGPFAHYSVRLFSSLESSYIRRRRRGVGKNRGAAAATAAKKRSSVPNLPDVLDIQLPSKDLVSPGVDKTAKPVVAVASVGSTTPNDGGSMPQPPFVSTSTDSGSRNGTSMNGNRRRSSIGNGGGEDAEKRDGSNANIDNTGDAAVSASQQQQTKKNVAQFLKQIPDLSYMLSSKLSSFSSPDGE